MSKGLNDTKALENHPISHVFSISKIKTKTILSIKHLLAIISSILLYLYVPQTAEKYKRWTYLETSGCIFTAYGLSVRNTFQDFFWNIQGVLPTLLYNSTSFYWLTLS